MIYVMRNPKDVMVSYFPFSKNMKTLDSSENLDQMLEKFFTGFNEKTLLNQQPLISYVKCHFNTNLGKEMYTMG
ncbi:MAG: sulfotransferase domain-containing protein [Plesiomonas sp.]|uniref:sulfotransferase domain-containing protein n=1 Tax=Plesiomonas sp. TaxID=2486279 RepID=UPI003F32F9D3